MAWHLYVIRTTDQKLYAGVTTDVQRRFKEHLSQGQRTARYLRAHKPKTLVFSQVLSDPDEGLELRPEAENQLRRSLTAAKAGKRGASFQEVAARLGLGV